MKLLKLNQEGISHFLVPALFVIVIALIGVRVLTTSHAATNTDSVQSTGIVENVVSGPKGLPPISQAGSLSPDASSTNGSCTGGTCYYYATMSEGNISAIGATAEFSQAQPKVGAKDYHSLTELAVSSPDGKQIAEIGWIVAPPMFHDSLTHLFIFHWVNSTPTCYNGCGFVSTSKTYHAGGLVQVGVGGTYSIQFKNNQWQFIYNGTLIGYLPSSAWNGAFTKVGWASAFGEVAATSTTTPHSQMGNGLFGTAPKSALIRNFNLVNAAKSNTLSYNAANAPAVYNIGSINRSCTSSCGMNFGGPGYP